MVLKYDILDKKIITKCCCILLCLPVFCKASTHTGIHDHHWIRSHVHIFISNKIVELCDGNGHLFELVRELRSFLSRHWADLWRRTRYILPTLMQCWASVEDANPSLHQLWFDDFCLTTMGSMGPDQSDIKQAVASYKRCARLSGDIMLLWYDIISVGKEVLYVIAQCALCIAVYYVENQHIDR